MIRDNRSKSGAVIPLLRGDNIAPPAREFKPGSRFSGARIRADFRANADKFLREQRAWLDKSAASI